MKIRCFFVGGSAGCGGRKTQPRWITDFSTNIWMFASHTVSHISNNSGLRLGMGWGFPVGNSSCFTQVTWPSEATVGFVQTSHGQPEKTTPACSVREGGKLSPKKVTQLWMIFFWRIEDGFAPKLLNIVAEKFLLGWPLFVGLYYFLWASGPSTNEFSQSLILRGLPVLALAADWQLRCSHILPPNSNPLEIRP